MRGVLIVSHGTLCEGFLNAAKVILGGEFENVRSVSLVQGENPEKFKEEIRKAIDHFENTQEIIILADLVGGTPSNIAAHFIDEHIHLIAGFNFSLLLEVLTQIDSEREFNYSKMVENTKKSVLYINEYLKKKNN